MLEKLIMLVTWCDSVECILVLEEGWIRGTQHERTWEWGGGDYCMGLVEGTRAVVPGSSAGQRRKSSWSDTKIFKRTKLPPLFNQEYMESVVVLS